MQINISQLLGHTLIRAEMSPDHSEIQFESTTGEKWMMFHSQGCCESVRVEDVGGDLQDLVGSPIIQAEESTNRDNPPDHAESFTWTFYRIATNKGQCVIRWLGQSNGYYSESVDFVRV